MKKIFTLLILGMALFSTSCEKEPFLEYELPNFGNTLEFEAEGGSVDIDITADCGYEVLCKDSWASVEETESGIRVKVDANIKTESRKTEIRLLYNYKKEQLYKSIKVVQKAFEPTLSVDKTKLSFDGNGGTQYIYVTTNVAEYSVSKSSSWLSCTQSGNKVTIYVTESNVSFKRIAEIKIDLNSYGLSETISILQEAHNNVILYTTYDSRVINIDSTNNFGANIVYNRLVDGVGVIKFDAPVTSIGEEAFYECSSLTSIIIPDSVTSIGSSAFYQCTSLKSATIPNSVTSIGSSAFYQCTSLKSATIPNSVTSIGSSAFYRCTSLKSVTIPNSVTSIGESAFHVCSSLTRVTIPDSVTSIGEDTFRGCSSLKSATIGNSVTSIGKYAFFDCRQLEDVTIGNSVTSIGQQAFYNCTSLTSVTIPDSVTSIGDAAFRGCSSLKSATIGNSVTSIGKYAFFDCRPLIDITIGNSVTSIGEDAFANCFLYTGKVYISDLSAWCKIYFGNSTANPLHNAHALYLNGELVTELNIPSDITGIKRYTFHGCHSLKSVTIPNSVTSIGFAAFRDCGSLTSVYCKAATPPEGEASMFDGNAYGFKIYVPAASYWKYRAAWNWGDYASYIVGYDF